MDSRKLFQHTGRLTKPWSHMEVEAVSYTTTGAQMVVPDRVADAFGVYVRGTNGLARHIEDFESREEAEAFVSLVLNLIETAGAAATPPGDSYESLSLPRVTEAEAQDWFHRAICNVHGYGCMYYAANRTDYSRVRAMLQADNPKTELAIEDIYIKMLDLGYRIVLFDYEEHGNEALTKPPGHGLVRLTWEDIVKRMQALPERFANDMRSENDDAVTADAVLQHLVYGEIIYG